MTRAGQAAAIAAALLCWAGTASAATTESEIEAAMGEALLSQGDPAGATVHLEAAIGIDPSNERARLLLARAHAAAGETAAAIHDLDLLLETYPGDPSLLREQAFVMILDGDYMWAVQALTEAIAKDPDDALAQLYLGYAAIALESHADAVEPLAKAAGTGTDTGTGADGPIAGTAAYLEAVALGTTGDTEAAYSAVKDAIAAGLASDPWTQAALALRSTLGKRLVPFRLLDLSLSAGLYWDSNVALFSQDIARLMLDQGTDPRSFGLSLGGSIFLRPFRGRTWALGAGLSIYQTFNFSRDVADFDTTVYGVSAEIVRVWGEGSPLSQVSLRYVQSLLCLMGGPLVDFDRYYRFSNSYGLEAGAEFSEGDLGALRIRMLWRYGLFTDYGRDGIGYSAGLNQTFFLWGRKLKIAIEAGIKVEHAENLAWDRIGPRAFAGLSILLPGEIQAVASFSWERMDHHESGPETRWGSHRVDDSLAYGISLSRTFLGQLTLGAGFVYTDNMSTLKLSYDYDRAVVTVTLAWRLK